MFESASRASRGFMTDTESATPEGELDPTDLPPSSDSDDESPGEGEEVVIDAMTGEVSTVTAAELAAEEAA